MSDQCLKERFLCGPDLTLTKFVDICRAAESIPSGDHSSPTAGHGSAFGGSGAYNSNKSAKGASIWSSLESQSICTSMVMRYEFVSGIKTPTWL